MKPVNYILMISIGLGFIWSLFLPPALIPALALEPDRMLSQYLITTFNTDAGLPNSGVTSMFQAKDGFIWLTTFGGICKFDGNSFTVFNKSSVDEIQIDGFWSSCQGADQTLWFGSNGDGLYRKTLNGWQHYTQQHGLIGTIVTALFSDHRGTIWAGTNQGLFFRDQWQFQPAAQTISEFPETLYITIIIEDSNQRLLVGTRNNGLFIIDNRDLSVVNLSTSSTPALKGNHIYGITEGLNGEIWISIYGGGITRLVLDQKGKSELEPEPVLETIDFKDHDPGLNTTCLYYDNDHQVLYLGSETGVYRYYNQQLDHLSTEHGISDNTQQSFLKDSEGNFWLGTWRGGLNRLRRGSFINFSTRQGLPNPVVHAITRGPDNLIWAGTQGGLAHYNDKSILSTFTAVEIPAEVIDPQFSNHRMIIRSFLTDSADRFWISSYQGLLLRYPDGSYSHLTADSHGLSSNQLRRSIEDHRGQIWLGSRDGLNIININQSGEISIEVKTLENSPEMLQNNFVQALTRDSQNRIFLGTDGGGLTVIDNDLKTSTIYQKSDGLASNVVFDILEDSKKQIWISTNNGISRFSSDRTFQSVTARQGLPTDTIFKIIEDKDQNFWLTSPAGIFFASGLELSAACDNPDYQMLITEFSSRQGLISTDCTAGGQSFYDSKHSGQIYFATAAGISRITPGKIVKNLQPPQTHIIEFLIDNQPPLSQNTTGEYLLPPGVKNLEFRYTATSFTDARQVLYRYRLSGYDQNWVEAQNRRIAYYTALNPGSYTFEVKSCNNDGVWSLTSASVRFRQLPYFHQTIQFRILLSFLLLLLFWFIYHLKTLRLRRRNLQLENLVAERTREISAKNRENEKLLLNILPRSIAERLKKQEENIADSYKDVSILFADIIGFTELSQQLNSTQVVSLLNALFSAFDQLCLNLGVEKIKTIGDGYMAAAGIPEPISDHARRSGQLGLEMLYALDRFNREQHLELKLRIGIHSGEIIAGVIGAHKFSYDLWGDTVNTASRMESHGTAGKIHVSEQFYQLSQKHFKFEQRGEISIKGKGRLNTWYLIAPRSSVHNQVKDGNQKSSKSMPQ